MKSKLNLSPDFNDMLDCLSDEGAEFVIVGGYAMAVHGYIRATGDLDIFVNTQSDNAEKVFRSLTRFGAPLNNICAEDFTKPGTVYQMGLPPFRIDIITTIDGVDFDESFRNALRITNGDRTIPILSLTHLIANKLSTGREKDVLDAKEMKKLVKEQHDA